MSAESVMRAALVTALRGDAVLAAGLNGVFEGPPVKATPPYAEIGELLSGDWSVKDRAGRELRLMVTVRDAGDAPGRLHALAGAVGDAIEALPRDLDGWRVASVAFVRTRMPRQAPGRWATVIEYRVRMLAA